MFSRICTVNFELNHLLRYVFKYFFISCSFVSRIFDHALADSQSKSSLVHSLSVCISLLDPRRSITSPLIHSFRSQHMQESPVYVNSETVDAMLPKLGKNMYIYWLFCMPFSRGGNFWWEGLTAPTSPIFRSRIWPVNTIIYPSPTGWHELQIGCVRHDSEGVMITFAHSPYIRMDQAKNNIKME